MQLATNAHSSGFFYCLISPWCFILDCPNFVELKGGGLGYILYGFKFDFFGSPLTLELILYFV